MSSTAHTASGDMMPPLPPTGRFGASLFMSLALHAAVLIVLAGVSLRIAATAPPIVVTIREPAAPPPPLGDPAATGAAPAAVPQPAAHPQPAVPKPRPKIAHRPPPATAPMMMPESAVASSPFVDGAVNAPGVPDGAIGGVAGGQVGGTVGGHGDHLWRADEVAAQPEVISRSMPSYPPLARARGIEGLVVLEGIVDRTGRIEADGLKVLQSIPMLDDAALMAFRQWRFKPGRDQSGEAVRVVLQVPIRFQLR